MIDWPYIVTCPLCKHAAYRVFKETAFYACPGCLRAYSLTVGLMLDERSARPAEAGEGAAG